MGELRIEVKTLTQHPAGKRGVSISKSKYEAVRAAILGCLGVQNQLTHTNLAKCVVGDLKARPEGSVNWHVEEGRTPRDTTESAT
jgi:hypothetical protein